MDIAKLTDDQIKAALAQAQARLEKIQSTRQLETYEPYPKQAEFHAMGAVKRERLLSAGNQLGKTFCGAAEAAMHLTGRYPHWWTGRRFERAVRAMAGSVSGELTRNGVQRYLLGPPEHEEKWGTGMIPSGSISQHPLRRSGVKHAVDSIQVRHAQGGISTIQFKSFDQGRLKWQADTIDFVWLDEEPPYDIYEEALTRTNRTGGMVYITFTPLQGMSEVVKKFFLEPGPDRGKVMMELDDVPTLTAAEKAKIIASYDARTLDARTRGIPVLGSGPIFPVTRDMITCDPIPIPEHWQRIAAFDFGWAHPTAAVEAAWDRDMDTVYILREYRRDQQTPPVHAAELRHWGKDLTFLWPHDGRAIEKGTGLNLATQYRATGLKMHHEHVTAADGSISTEASISDCLSRFNDGRLKIFRTCPMLLSEIDVYHRDKDGDIVRVDDDLISAMRYVVMGKRFAKAQSRRVHNAAFRAPVALGTGEVII